MIPNEVISQIENEADIANVISSYIPVTKKGNSYLAICPFHDDKTPSLHITPQKKIFKCFACGEGGNVFSFVSKYEHIGFYESVKKVASLIGFDSPYLNEVQGRTVDNKTKGILKALNDAKEFYHYVLSTQPGAEGKQYLLSRDIPEEMIDYFSLGFSPDMGSLTIKQLRGKDNSVDALSDAGILVHQGDNFTDRYQGRVMFPIFNEYDEVVGFSGRIIKKTEDAKYVNSPASDLFNKSKILYNYQNAKREAKKEKYVYVVEGFMDVIALYKAGIKSAVALMGTAFTKYHAKLLKRLNVEVRLCLDGDHPGQHGMLSMLKILDEEQIPYMIVNYEGDERDPDEILVQSGKDALINRVNTLFKKHEFVLAYYKTNNKLTTADEKKQFLNEVGTYYLSLDDEIDKDLFINEIAKITNVLPSKLIGYFNKFKKPESNKEYFDGEIGESYNRPSENQFSSLDKLKIPKKIKTIQRNLIFYMLKSYDACKYIAESQVSPFIEDIYLILASYVEDMYEDNKSIDISSLVSRIQEEQKDNKYVNELTDITLDQSIPYPFDQENIDECLQSFKKIMYKKQFDQQINKVDDLDNDELERAKLLDEHINKKN